jgi:hypothetical protein
MSAENIKQKIGILTYHNGFNFGAYLQVYGLQRALEGMGFTPEVIDYKSWYHKYFEYRCLFYTRRPSLFIGNIQKMRAFFKAHRMLKLSRHVNSAKGFDGLRYDAVVFGSDEIWNYSNPIVKLDPVYFGLGVPCKQRISYAASCGSLPCDIVVPVVVANGWQNFNAISVRDENSQSIVSRYVSTAVKIVWDPTFLVDFSAEEVACPLKDFILVYTTGFSTDMQHAVRGYADRTGKRLISLGYRNAFCDENILGIGPFEFLGWYRAASVVITSMFHGTIFGIKYNKPLAIVPDPYRTNKLATMLDLLALRDHITNADGLEETLVRPIAYDQVNKRIQEGVADSLNYLRQNLLGVVVD